MPYICPVCTKPWRNGQKSIQCSTCNGWVHHKNRLNCSGITDTEFDIHNDDEDNFFECDSCVSAITIKTFAHLPQFESPIFNESIATPMNLFTSAKANHKDFLDKCSNIDIFLNITDHVDDELLSAVNSKYHDVDKFNSLEIDVPSSFNLCHVNIASLDNHIDDLRLVLSRLKHKFDIIGISEHKIKKNSTPSNNIDLIGYNQFLFEPTETTHGGTFFLSKITLTLSRGKISN